MTLQNPPEGYTSVTPYLVVDGAAAAIDFYASALNAVEIMRMAMGDRIGHAEIRIGNAIVMLSDAFPEMNLASPNTRGGPSSSIMMYVPDVDAAFALAIAAGATEVNAPSDMFWGDRMGTIIDPFGHRWMLGTHVEDVTPEQVAERMKAFSPGA